MARYPAVLLASLLLSPTLGCGGKSDSPPAPPAPAAQATPPSAGADPAPTAPAAHAPGPESFTGVTFEVTASGKTETVALSDAIIGARGGGPLAVFDCAPGLGSVGVTDFGVGDDPNKRGALFVARVDLAGIAQVRPDTPLNANISLRRAGEPTPTSFRGTMTWDATHASGAASGAADDGSEVELRWTCEPKSG